MTSTQVRYWDLQETKRKNKVAETQNKYHLVTERMSATETKRHNIASEKLGTYDAITRRLTASETKRHNKAQEKETYRHNKAGERSIPSSIALNRAKTSESYTKSTLNTATAGLNVAKTSETAVNTKLKLNQLDKFNLMAVLTTGPKWAKSISAAALLGDIIADPKQNKTLKQAAADAWKSVENTQVEDKTYLFTANGYNYYMQYSNATGLNMFSKEKVGSKGKSSKAQSMSQVNKDFRKNAVRQTEQRLKSANTKGIAYDRSQAARRRATNK